MLNNAKFFKLLVDNGIDFFTGVPDSLLKDFCSYIADHTTEKQHIIAANEGGAVALAAGHYLATGQPALAYMQNAGEGNAVNPLLSLANPEVYAVPMLLVIGWRGEPIRQAQGKQDEPQHLPQGRATLPLLKAMKIDYQELSADESVAADQVKRAITAMKQNKSPYALVVRKDTFDKYTSAKKASASQYELSREEAIKLIAGAIGSEAIIVSTTGMTSRELFEYRQARQESHQQDFLNIGAMGHASQIALGIALAKPERIVYCLDGDGAIIMHMGSLAIAGSQKLANFRHIVLNNGAHDSVGGQPTAGFKISFTEIAKACGYQEVWLAKNKNELMAALKKLVVASGPALLEVRIKKGARENLGRPNISPRKMKEGFMKFL